MDEMVKASRWLRVQKMLVRIAPYFLLLGLSLMSLYLFFYDGLLIGDDIRFHLGNISDEYLSLISSGSIPRISTYLAENLGVGNRLFYSPLFHLLSALIYFVTSGIGGNAVDAIKIVVFLSVFVSGVIMYRFILKTSHGNKVAAALAAAIYIVYPYRIFDAICRAAYAEALAFTFLPLFFMGLYGVVSFKDNIKVLPFIETIIGGALLFLSHNLTAMFGFIFGVIFLMANAKKIAVLTRDHRRYLLTCIASLALLFGFMSVQLFSSLELMGTGIYNISNREQMWTTLPQVINRINTSFGFSGFLNFPYMDSHYFSVMNTSSMLAEIIFFLMLSAFFIAMDKMLAGIKKLRCFHFLISALVYLGLIFAFAYRLEVVLGALAIIAAYFLIECLLASARGESARLPFYKDVEFWFLSGSLIAAFALITQKWVWSILPDAVLNIQFPWRLWAYIQFFGSWMIGWLLTAFQHKKVVPYLAVAAIGLCLVTNQALPEKRLLRDLVDSGQSGAAILYGEEDFLSSTASIGWNKEYIPQVFTQDDYVSEYANTLYYQVRTALSSRYEDDYPFDPVVLSGACTIDVANRDTPDYDLDVAAEEESLIQMPLIYYPGYRVTTIDDAGSKSRVATQNIDGLVSFAISADIDIVEVTYAGTDLMIFSYVLISVSLAGAIGLALFCAFVPERKKIIARSPSDIAIGRRDDF